MVLHQQLTGDSRTTETHGQELPQEYSTEDIPGGRVGRREGGGGREWMWKSWGRDDTRVEHV